MGSVLVGCLSASGAGAGLDSDVDWCVDFDRMGSWEAAREWIINPDIPLWIKVAGISFWAGCAIMLVSVVREKLFLHKHERYKDIQR